MAHLRLKLDVTKLDKTVFFHGQNGAIYCDLTLWENDDPDKYGNTYSVKQDMGKDRKGEKTPYVGNAKPFGESALGITSPEYGKRETSQGGAKPPICAMNDDLDSDDEIPF